MPEFSMELFKKKENQEYNSSALQTLAILKERVANKQDLFNAKDEKQFEFLKQAHPIEYAILENDELFNDKSDDEKRQILFNMVNPKVFLDVKKAKVSELEPDTYNNSENSLTQVKAVDDLDQLTLPLN